MTRPFSFIAKFVLALAALTVLSQAAEAAPRHHHHHHHHHHRMH